MNDKYFDYLCNKYEKFICDILNSIVINNYNVIIEAGCGICSITRSLIEQDPERVYIGLDKSKKMLDLSLHNLLAIPNKENFTLAQCDIVKEQYCGDLVHSHGVLEHFSDKQIQKIICYQRKNFKELIHYVPSYKYKTPSFGDERLLTINQWKKICNPNEIIEFNDGYDLILKWKT